MKKLFLTFLFLLSVITSFAYDALIDGVYYNLNKDEQTAEVTNATGMGWSYSYSGSVVIPETIAVDGVSYSVTSIGAMAFMACSDVTSVTMPNTVTTIGGDTFAQCVALSSVTLSNSLKYIGGGAFRFCQELTSVEIPNSVTSIGDYAFSGCSDMTSVSIPKSVTSIGDFAFANCTSLSEVYVEWEEPLAIPAHVFANVESSSVRRYMSKSLLSTTLYVPKGTKEKYAAADVWKDFSAIMEYDPTGISSILSDSKAKVAKHLVNGRLIIEKDGKRYDACGAEMK